ncbi:hypothetical protein FGO68_gene4252 [Halteria grandinella]|uniref:Uncharacterized protein n=1 Tax=Halteria grandinella TaxID=5974 RepID=A0A8J8P543_HALGN|nr:hypothetical protein FGO68_gene4252 [Halteria grandinella]
MVLRNFQYFNCTQAISLAYQSFKSYTKRSQQLSEMRRIFPLSTVFSRACFSFSNLNSNYWIPLLKANSVIQLIEVKFFASPSQ